MLYRDRQDAGQRLAAELVRYKDERPVVLALPRGGVPIGFEIAQRLHAPLDVMLVRKIGAPGMTELAIGAIVDGGQLDKFIDEQLVAELGVPQDYLDREIERQAAEIERRRKLYFRGRARVALEQRTAIVVDDGIATGATMRIALRAARRQHPARLVLAVPVAPERTVDAFCKEADDIVCLATPRGFMAIGQYYDDFRQTEDEEVIRLLDRAAKMTLEPVPGDAGEPTPSGDQAAGRPRTGR